LDPSPTGRGILDIHVDLALALKGRKLPFRFGAQAWQLQ
jgi:hypothetical protein